MTCCTCSCLASCLAIMHSNCQSAACPPLPWHAMSQQPHRPLDNACAQRRAAPAGCVCQCQCACRSGRGARPCFTFDAAFGPASTQAQLFAEVQPVVTSVLDGYNVCIFAYGQTGSGKTHTMEGPRTDPGINARTLAGLFQLSRQRAAQTQHTITLSLLEVRGLTAQSRCLLSSMCRRVFTGVLGHHGCPLCL